MGGHQKSFTNSPTHRRRRPCLTATSSVMSMPPRPFVHAIWGVMLGLCGGESAPIRSHAANATATPLLHEDVRLGPPGEARHARVDRHVISVRLLPHPPRGCASIGRPVAARGVHRRSSGCAGRRGFAPVRESRRRCWPSSCTPTDRPSCWFMMEAQNQSVRSLWKHAGASARVAGGEGDFDGFWRRRSGPRRHAVGNQHC